MTYYVSSGTLNHTRSLTDVVLWLVHTADADETKLIETWSRRDKTVLSRLVGGVNKLLQKRSQAGLDSALTL